MKYKIGKIANLLGVSIETVRNYERMGLILPERSDSSDYRLYDAVDVNILRRARTYTGYHGVSMKQSVQLISEGSVEDLSQALGASADQLSTELTRQMQLLLFTREKQSRLHRLSASENVCFIENSPAMYGFTYRHGLDFSLSPAIQQLFHSWNMLRPFTEASISYDRETFFSDNYQLSHGLVIEESYARFFQITENAHVHYFPSRRCLFSFFSVPLEPRATAESTFRHTLQEALTRLHLTPTDDPFGRVVHTTRVSGECRHYIELWIPID